MYFFERRYAKAREVLGRVVTADPTFTLTHERLAEAWMLEGREDEAWREAQLIPDCRDGINDSREIWTAWLPNQNRQAAKEALAHLESDRSTAAWYLPPW